MFKKIFGVLFFAFISIFVLTLSVYAYDETETMDSEDCFESENDVLISEDFDFDAFIASCDESLDIPDSYDFNYDAEKHQNRDPVYGQIYGYILWTDDYNNTHALQDVTVVVSVDNGSDIMTRTNSAGFYLINFYVSNPSVGADVDITIYSSCSYVRVYQSDEQTPYYKNDNIHMSGYYSDVYNYTFTNSVDGNHSRGMQILAAMQNYYNYASGLVSTCGFDPITLCKAKYPCSNISGCYYDETDDTIYLCAENNSSGDLYVYSSWDVIGHEYGHHLQHCYFNQSFGGSHNFVNCDYYSLLVADQTASLPKYPLPMSDTNKGNLKEDGCCMAFGESWATFFSLSAQKSFSTDIKQVPTVNNTSYEAYNGLDWDVADLYTSAFNSGGESTEGVVSSILYNLWDTNNSESWDNITISDVALFSLMHTYNPENLSDFLFRVLSTSSISVSLSDLGKMLAAFQVSPYNLSINLYPNSSHGAGFTWKRGNINMSHLGVDYPFNNNYFHLVFYDENDNFLLTKYVSPSNQYAITDNESCVLTSYEWSLLLQCSTQKYYVVVVGYSNNYYSTGPFYSERYYFDIPTTFDINLNDFSYYEKQFTITQSQAWLFNINFSHSGYKLIQTFGSGDTIMSLYNDSNVLLLSSDDEGYSNNALLYYNFNANQAYHLYVNFYSQNVSGMEKLTITPCSGEFLNGATVIDEYSDINSVGNQNYISYQTTIPQNESKVLLWTPSSTGYYVIALFSQFDNILYVINPSSSNGIVEEVDYCDDYIIDSDQGTYDENAQLGKYCYSGETYFIVIGKHNPALSSGNITLVIYKTM